ncbi:MAG: hydrogen peroxide-inducible genes activator [Alphaproteobacteria bacterium]|nr:hydrogen peroxide-inducible genes activator [Alphaproteobacteria bacterium]
MIAVPSLRQLRHLAVLAEHGHFGRAARAAHVTQSTLSASIKELERTLGAVLIDRAQRRAVLTPLGQKIVERARLVIAEAEELVRAAKEGGAPLAGELRLGVIPTVAPYLLPPILPRLRKAHPKLRLFLTEDLTERLVAQLDAGTLDMLLLALPCDCGANETTAIARDAFSVVVPKGHRFAAQKQVAPEALQGEPVLLLKDGHCLREHALAACALRDLSAPEGFEATSLLTLVQMVDNGIGITLLPKMALDAGILRGTRLVARPLAGDRSFREIGVAWRRGSARRAEYAMLADALRGLIGERAVVAGRN